jgi:UDP-glucose 4-epimerase
MSILVTGGAGYIGSHMVMHLLENNYDVVVVDDLSLGNREALLANKFYETNIKDEEGMAKVFKENDIESIIHFAAYSLVGESMQDPLKYYENNLYGTYKILSYMQKYGVRNIVFSSTAAVYGQQPSPITEESANVPTNTYGETKLAIEKMMKWVSMAYGINYTALRYFNAAGSHISGRIGEKRKIETHLIPIALDVAMGKIDKLFIYGDDYDTPDGTCIRDYIHVSDLASAHLLALENMKKNASDGIGHGYVYNLGSDKGFSVKEIVDAVKNVTGIDIRTEIAKRRAGDPAILVASSNKIKKELNWNPKFTDINEIIMTAWKFRQQMRWSK